MTTTERPPTIYEKIFAGDIPSLPIYEDRKNGILAILDIFPATTGHTIVIPAEATDRVYDLSEIRYAQLGVATQAISRHIQARLNPLRVTEHVYGFQVPHAHRMLVPSYERGDVAFLNDPARMQQPADKQQLANLQDILALTDRESSALQHRIEGIGVLLADAT